MTIIKPNLSQAPNLPSVSVQTYERYLPTAFDDSLSILEKMNKVIQQLNKMGDISNNIVNQWNELMEWILGNGLTDVVSEELNRRIEDGTINELIAIIVGDLSQLNTVDKQDLVNALNEVFKVATDNDNEIGNMDELETVDKTSLVHAINELKQFSNIYHDVPVLAGEATGHGVISGLKVRQQQVLSMAVEVGNSTTPNIVHMPNGARYTPNSLALPVDPSHATLNRIDMIYVSVDGELSYLAGVPALNPSPPALPDGAVILAHINVLATDTSVNDSDIVDKRNLKSLDVLLTNNKSNIVQAINEIITSLNDVINNAVGDVDTLTTSNKSTVVNAINEIVSNIGVLNNLPTTDKTSIVNALIEIVDESATKIDVNNRFGDLANLPTTDKTSIVNAIIEIVNESATKTDLGDLINLPTTDKSSIVNALVEIINESATKIDVTNMVGDLTTLPTTDKTSIVNAIIEVFNSLDEVINDSVGDKTNLNTTDKSSVVNAINEVNTETLKKMNKSSLFVSVKDFGAKGDGVTDDTFAIKNALNSVHVQASGRDGALVFFPAGTYLISEAIELFGNVTIQGVGRRGSTLLLKAGSSAEAMLIRKGDTVVYWTQIKDICLDGQASLQTANTDGIKLGNVTECLIENVGIRFVRGHGIRIHGMNGGQSIQPTIRNCIIRADALHHADNSSGIFLDEGSYDGMVEGNDVGFYKKGNGIWLVAHYGSFLSNNNVWQNKNGFNIQSSFRTRISNCLSDYAQEFGYFFNTSSEFQVVNCQSRWSSNKVGAVQLYDGFHLYRCSVFIMTGCSVLGGNGIDTLDGGTGQTGFAVAFTGGTNKGKIVGLLSDKVKGEYYQDADVVDIEKMPTVDDNIKFGTQYVGTDFANVTVLFDKPRKNIDYSISVTPTWETSFWVTNVTVNGFTINFSLPPTEPKNCYWSINQL